MVDGLVLLIVTYSGVDKRLNCLGVVALTSFSVINSSSKAYSVGSSDSTGLLVVVDLFHISLKHKIFGSIHNFHYLLLAMLTYCGLPLGLVSVFFAS